MAGKFKLIKKTKFSELDKDSQIPRSDLALQDEGYLYQFKLVDKSKPRKKKIKPGVFTLKSTNFGLSLAEIELGKKRLLLDVVNTKSIMDEANNFFSKLDIYDQLDRPKKRGVLIYSSPGQGKSSTIAQFCNESRQTEPGTVVIVWPTSKVSADEILDLFTVEATFSKKCTRLILVLEDIGGSEFEEGARRGVDSGLLNLLDGVSFTFKLPTFIIATTNHPANLLESLADRPGRFDLMLELKPPSKEERLKLISFISKRDLTKEEIEVFSHKECDELSIAHLDEIVVRSLLHNKDMKETLREILDHRKNVSKAFEDIKRKSGIGFSLSNDDF